MKLYKNAIILVLVLGLMAGAYFLLQNKKSTTGDGNTNTNTNTQNEDKLMKYDSTELLKAEVNNRGNMFKFEYQKTSKERKDEIIAEEKARLTAQQMDPSTASAPDYEWVMTYPGSFRASPDNIINFQYSALNIFTNKVVEEKAKDLSIYGFDKPVKIDVTFADKKSDGFEIGNMNSTKTAYYARMKNSSKVYTIDTTDAEKFMLSELTLKDKKIFKLDDTKTTGFEFFRNGEFVCNGNKDGDYYRMTKPVFGEINSEFVTQIVKNTAFLGTEKYIEISAGDLDKYGLAKPLYEIRFVNDGEKHVLYLGGKQESGYYAKTDQSNDVFVVNSEAFTVIDKPLKEIIDPFAYLVNIEKVSNVRFELDGAKYDLKIVYDTSKEHDNDKDRFYLNGKDANQFKDDKTGQYSRELYQSLLSIIHDETVLDAKPSGKAEVTIVFVHKDPKTADVKIELVPKDKYYYYIKRDGIYTGKIMYKSKLDQEDGLRVKYKALIAAMKKDGKW